MQTTRERERWKKIWFDLSGRGKSGSALESDRDQEAARLSRLCGAGVGKLPSRGILFMGNPWALLGVSFGSCAPPGGKI